MNGQSEPADKDGLKSALRALMASLDDLDDAVDRQLEDRARIAALDSEMTDIMLDRSRLAQTLDKAEARSARLEDANREVSRRLVGAMEMIRAVLDGQKRQA